MLTELTGEQTPQGEYQSARPEAKAAGAAPSHALSAESGRYHVYLDNACPWCHRVGIALALRGQRSDVGVTRVFSDGNPDKETRPNDGAGGWCFMKKDKDPLCNAENLRDVYDACHGGPGSYSGACTAPLLVDLETKQVISNESGDIIRMLSAIDFGKGVHKTPEGDAVVDLCPVQHQPDIEATNEWVYTLINNGVYRAGYATTQRAYAAAEADVHKGLQRADELLATQRFLCGDTVTEADLRLLPTATRFDGIYANIFKCGRKLISRNYPHVNRWMKDMLLLTGPDLFNLDDARRSFYRDLYPLNPSGIVPAGPGTAELGFPGMAEDDNERKREREYMMSADWEAAFSYRTLSEEELAALGTVDDEARYVKAPWADLSRKGSKAEAADEVEKAADDELLSFVIGACQGVFSARIMNMSESLKAQREAEAERAAAFPPDDGPNVTCALSPPPPPKPKLRGSLLESLVRGVVIKDVKEADYKDMKNVSGRPPPACDLPPQQDLLGKATGMAGKAVGAAGKAAGMAGKAAGVAGKAAGAMGGKILDSDVVGQVSSRMQNSSRVQRGVEAGKRAVKVGKAAATIGKAMLPPKEEVIDSLRQKSDELLRNSSELLGKALGEAGKEQLQNAGEFLGKMLGDAPELLGENSSLGGFLGDAFKKGFPFGRRQLDEAATASATLGGAVSAFLGDVWNGFGFGQGEAASAHLSRADGADAEAAAPAVAAAPAGAARQLQAAAGEPDGGLSMWLDDWHARFECWWMWLPTPTQTQLGSCMGALALHLGSRWDAALRSLGMSSATATGSAEPECEWVDRGAAELQLPDFPDFSPDMQLRLPPIPRLLPSWERLQALQEYATQYYAAVPGVAPGAAPGSERAARSGEASAALEPQPLASWSALGAGAGGGAAFTLALVALWRVRSGSQGLGRVQIRGGSERKKQLGGAGLRKTTEEKNGPGEAALPQY